MRRTTAALIVGGVLALAAPTAAHAATIAVDDTTSDVWESVWNQEAETEELTEAGSPLNVDVTTVKLRHTSRKIFITTSYVDLEREEVFFGNGATMRFDQGPRLHTSSDTWEGWRGKARLVELGSGDPVKCGGLDVTIAYAANTTETVVPRSCVGGPRWVEVSHSAYGCRPDAEAPEGGHNYVDNGLNAGHEYDGWSPRARRG